jgi:hypothetical protein
MSYQKDLEEYTDDELREEQFRRELRRKQGLCSYCNKTLGGEKNTCRYHEEKVETFRGTTYRRMS